MQNIFDIISQGITNEEWQKLKLKVESAKAFQASEVFKAKRESAINFGDWILKHDVVSGYDDEGFSCWVVPNGKGEVYTTLELHTIYITGKWEEDDEDDMSIWDQTLNDGLEDE